MSGGRSGGRESGIRRALRVTARPLPARAHSRAPGLPALTPAAPRPLPRGPRSQQSRGARVPGAKTCALCHCPRGPGRARSGGRSLERMARQRKRRGHSEWRGRHGAGAPSSCQPGRHTHRSRRHSCPPGVRWPAGHAPSPPPPRSPRACAPQVSSCTPAPCPGHLRPKLAKGARRRKGPGPQSLLPRTKWGGPRGPRPGDRARADP